MHLNADHRRWGPVSRAVFEEYEVQHQCMWLGGETRMSDTRTTNTTIEEGTEVGP